MPKKDGEESDKHNSPHVRKTTFYISQDQLTLGRGLGQKVRSFLGLTAPGPILNLQCLLAALSQLQPALSPKHQWVSKWCWQEVCAGIWQLSLCPWESARETGLSQSHGEVWSAYLSHPKRDSGLVSASHTTAPPRQAPLPCSCIHGGAQHSEPSNGRHTT